MSASQTRKARRAKPSRKNERRIHVNKYRPVVDAPPPRPKRIEVKLGVQRTCFCGRMILAWIEDESDAADTKRIFAQLKRHYLRFSGCRRQVSEWVQENSRPLPADYHQEIPDEL